MKGAGRPHFYQNWKKLWEIPQRRRYQGFISWPFAYYFEVVSQINLYIQKS